MTDDHPILKMTVATTAGWTISLSEVETGLRILSLAVPTFLSILVYVKNRKKKNDETP